MAFKSGRERIRLLVVDDSAFVRRAIIRMFENSADIEVVGFASDGAGAVQLAATLHPDVITLDVQMPVLDGLAALELIMRQCPTPVIMFSSLTGKGGEKTLKALEMGAVDFIDKSSAGGNMDIVALARELTAKILVASRVDLDKLPTVSLQAANEEGAALRPASRTCARPQRSETEVVLIGTSTGGPPALQTVLSQLPAGLPYPVLVVQHMAPGFTASLAKRLDRASFVQVSEARDGEPVLPGRVYVAPAGWHLRLVRQAGMLRVVLDPESGGYLHTPSVDVLFQSAAEVCGKRTLGVVLTGMGRDGAAGAAAIKEAGGKLMVESEDTAIVFGMPKAVLDGTEVDAVVPLYRVAETIARLT